MASAADENILRFSPLLLKNYVLELLLQNGQIKYITDCNKGDSGDLI
jgi:hypothetical protein